MPLESGRFRFYVEMREPRDDPATCAGKRTQKQFTLWIRQPISIVAAPALRPRSEVGVPVQMRLRARGGSGAFAWTRAVGLPNGVRLHADGSLAGTPRTAGTYRVEVWTRDTEARSASWIGTLRVARRLVIRTERLPAARVGRPYSAGLTAEGGVAPKKWKLTGGRLPRGIRFAPRLGRFTGTAKDVGTYRVNVNVRDGLRVRVAETFTIVVATPTTTVR
jgi:hypothetical protein